MTLLAMTLRKTTKNLSATRPLVISQKNLKANSPLLTANGKNK
jgi:hypothetical protein